MTGFQALVDLFENYSLNDGLAGLTRLETGLRQRAL
jgi:hypothetical protein